MTNQLKPDPGTFTSEDFVLWQKEGILQITPKFQRRPLWKTPNKSFFIDTMLRGMPVPPIYLRSTQNEERTKKIREVVDGQQRIRSVMEYLDDGYKLSKTLKNTTWAGKKFSELSDDEKERIRDFSFPVNIFYGVSDKQVLDIFARLNLYSVPLNDQELRNGKYFGYFKQLSSDLATDYLEFWRHHGIFTEDNIARMLEVSLTSELLIAGNSGMQDKKKSIEDFYKKWDDEYPDHARDEKRFRDVMGIISETFSTYSLKETEFRRSPMFYSLFCVVHHRCYGLPNVRRNTPKRKLNADDQQSLRDAILKLSEVIASVKEDKAKRIPEKYSAFMDAIGRQTDNIGPRNTMFNTIYETAF